jgi:hypothetical protein
MPGKKKHRDPEYALHIFHHNDERTGKSSVVILVRTIKEFTSFNYEILLNASMTERTIQVKILGLRTTPLIMPGIGPARGRKDFDNLGGEYTVQVSKLDGETNEFHLSVSASQIALYGSPARPFIAVSNEPVLLPQP